MRKKSVLKAQMFARKTLAALITSLFSLLLAPLSVSAHCPLCTVGAAAAAGGAAWLGVNQGVIGLFIGAFAVSMGWWISNLIKKKYVPLQRTALISISFITTIIPLLALMKEFYPVYLSLVGDYGSLLNRTYLINIFFVGSVLGGFVVCITPWLSKKITALRKNRTFPFQGVLITLLLLIILGIIVQLTLKSTI